MRKYEDSIRKYKDSMRKYKDLMRKYDYSLSKSTSGWSWLRSGFCFSYPKIIKFENSQIFE